MILEEVLHQFTKMKNMLYEAKKQEDFYKKKIQELEENIEVKRKALDQANYWTKFKDIYGSVSLGNLLDPEEKNKIAVESYERKIEFYKDQIRELMATIKVREYEIEIYDKDLEECCKVIDQLNKDLEKEKQKLAHVCPNPNGYIIYGGKKYVPSVF